MECPSTPIVIVLFGDDAIFFWINLSRCKSLTIDTRSDTTCWVPWNRLEGGE